MQVCYFCVFERLVRFTREQIFQICRTFVLSFVGRASWSLLGTQDNLSHCSVGELAGHEDNLSHCSLTYQPARFLATLSLKGSLDRDPKSIKTGCHHHLAFCGGDNPFYA
jgi:hypothetical protein